MISHPKIYDSRGEVGGGGHEGRVQITKTIKRADCLLRPQNQSLLTRHNLDDIILPSSALPPPPEEITPSMKHKCICDREMMNKLWSPFEPLVYFNAHAAGRHAAATSVTGSEKLLRMRTRGRGVGNMRLTSVSCPTPREPLYGRGAAASVSPL